MWDSMGYAKFDKPLIGAQDGLAVYFHVRVEEGTWFGVDGRVYLQIFLREADGSTDFVYNFPDVWRLLVADMKIDLPWWLTAILIGMTVSFGVAIPVIAPMLAVTTIGLLDGVIPSIVDNLENMAQQAAQDGVGAVTLPVPPPAPLPGLTKPDWNMSLRRVTVSPESIDVAIDSTPSIDVNAEPLGVITANGLVCVEQERDPTQPQAPR